MIYRYFHREAKILLIYRSIIGIVSFVVLYAVMLAVQNKYPNENFPLIQLMIFIALIVLAIIFSVSLYSLKKELSDQEEYLQNIHNEQKTVDEETVKIPYDKSGLYLIVVILAFSLVGFLYLYNVMIFHPSPSVIKSALETTALMLKVIIFAFTVVLVVAVKILYDRIKNPPLCQEYKRCPRCNSSEVYKLESLSLGGLLNPLVGQPFRCKKCGQLYDGTTGRDITRTVKSCGLLIILLILILEVLSFIIQ